MQSSRAGLGLGGGMLGALALLIAVSLAIQAASPALAAAPAPGGSLPGAPWSSVRTVQWAMVVEAGTAHAARPRAQRHDGPAVCTARTARVHDEVFGRAVPDAEVPCGVLRPIVLWTDLPPPFGA